MIYVLTGLVIFHSLYTAFRAYRLGRLARVRVKPQISAQTPRTSILIPAWNDAGVLARTCRALAAEVGERNGCEVIIIAGGSDGSLETAEGLAASLARSGVPWRVLPQAPAGKNAALNQALAIAEGDIIVFLDADTSVQPGWLNALTAPIAADRADATAGRFEAFEATQVSRIFELDQVVSQLIAEDVVLFGGGTIALRRTSLADLGGRLPEDVLVGVDWDLSTRLERAGARLAFAEKALVQTEVPQTWREYFKSEVRWKRAFFVNEAAHFGQDRALRRLMGLLYIPLVQALLLLGWGLFPLLSVLVGAGLWTGFVLWLIFSAWVLLRHAARCLSASAYEGAQWLKVLPGYLIGFYISAVASFRALFTLNRLSAHFKGRRTANA